MEENTKINPLEERVEDILKNKADIISLRTKLNAIASTKANNNLNKSPQKIERYKTIVDYFLEKDEQGNYLNKDRISSNRTYLVDAMNNLSKQITSAKFGYSENDNLYTIKSLCSKISNLLNETKETH